ncbi:MAG: sodium:alanine symporter family protein [Bacteroidota bacterium]
MELLAWLIDSVNGILKWPLLFALLGAGLFLTIRLGFIQFRRLGHGFAVATGRYDDPDEPGDVSHFQALTTALSATVGVGNIAGVALAIHIGGPGALFWMWVTAILGMCTKYSEVTLAQHFRVIVAPDRDSKKWEGSVAGGPMYYIEKGLGWKPVAIFFAGALMVTSFLTGNAVQANTIATEVQSVFGIEKWITGLLTAGIVGVVIIGGIQRIGRVTSIVAPAMAALYVLGALTILALNIGSVPVAFGQIFSEAFNPTSGVAGTGAGLFINVLVYGVQRGLFSNEAGQGSAPIAHSAAKTDEPVSEGAVALLEPFIDTLIICTLTGLVLITTGVYQERKIEAVSLGDSDVTIVEGTDAIGYSALVDYAEPIRYEGGVPVVAGGAQLGYIGLGADSLFLDATRTQPFSGTLRPADDTIEGADGSEISEVFASVFVASSPLTSFGFQRGLEPLGLGDVGRWIVLISVFLFAISTSISWSYYGDRCANYLFGTKAILPFKLVFVLMHFAGATLALQTVWDLGDVALSLVTIPNVIALVALSGLLVKLTNGYFERKPWVENAEVHKRVVAEKRGKKSEGRS